jgi:tRNA(Arg) A34 adenosine deaminase TadA
MLTPSVKARLALQTNETPVGAVFVSRGRVIAKGMNATNITRNGTRHAELMAISALLSFTPGADAKPKKVSAPKQPLADITNEAQAASDPWDNVNPEDGHLFPYGQKLHPSPRVGTSIFSETTLYVTVEPCVMCASLLRQLGLKKVYFGAVNDKFGGTGGVFRIHMNSSPASASKSGPPQRQVFGSVPKNQLATSNGTSGHGNDANSNTTDTACETPILEGDGGNVEPGFDAEGGWGRDEAVTLLRQFYVQENNRGKPG